MKESSYPFEFPWKNLIMDILTEQMFYDMFYVFQVSMVGFALAGPQSLVKN